MADRRTGRVARAAIVGTALVLLAGGCSEDAADSEGSGAAADGGSTDGAATAAPALDREVVDGSFEDLDGIVESAMEETGIPGVAVAVVYDDEVVYEQGYGVRVAGEDAPVDPDTVFQIASMSKPVSSTIMAGLVGDGVFEWDDPIGEHAPGLGLSDPWVSERVTFADLFSHRSGLPGAVAGNDLEAVGYDRETIMERLPFVPLEGFREVYSYSNFGMTMAGEAAAEAAGAEWEDVAEEVLFGPAGMESTSMRHEDFLAEENRAELHVEVDGEWVADFDRMPDAQAPAGGVTSTVGDLARWARLQLAGGELDGEVIIDADALAETHVPHMTTTPPASPGEQASFYGLGWSLRTEPTGHVVWNHSGAFSTGASTTVKLLPAEGLGVIVLTNGEPIGVPEAIADAYLELLFTGEVTTDWVELWGERFGGLYGEPGEWNTPVDDPAPAQADDVYVGTYANDYVGEVEVAVGADGLELRAGPDGVTVMSLVHHDGDEFTYVSAPELPDFADLATFTVEGDRAVSVTLTSFDGAGLGTLTRVG